MINGVRLSEGGGGLSEVGGGLSEVGEGAMIGGPQENREEGEIKLLMRVQSRREKTHRLKTAG